MLSGPDCDVIWESQGPLDSHPSPLFFSLAKASGETKEPIARWHYSSAERESWLLM